MYIASLQRGRFTSSKLSISMVYYVQISIPILHDFAAYKLITWRWIREFYALARLLMLALIEPAELFNPPSSPFSATDVITPLLRRCELGRNLPLLTFCLVNSCLNSPRMALTSCLAPVGDGEAASDKFLAVGGGEPEEHFSTNSDSSSVSLGKSETQDIETSFRADGSAASSRHIIS